METEIVFNCQMGRGRTTTGMVISTLVYLNRIGASGEHRCYQFVINIELVKKYNAPHAQLYDCQVFWISRDYLVFIYWWQLKACLMRTCLTIWLSHYALIVYAYTWIFRYLTCGVLSAAGIPRTSSIGKVFYAGNDVDDYSPSSEEAILRGEYAVIRSLVRVLEAIIWIC